MNILSRLHIKPKYLVIVGLITISVTSIWTHIPPVWTLSKTRQVAIVGKDQETAQIIGPNESDWVSLDRISKHTIHAIITAEDARFYQHFGIDIRAVLASAQVNLANGRIVRGASTITQQVIKIAFLTPDRTFDRKIKEALGAIALEFFMTKDEILEWYLNLVPFGNGAIGIAEASKMYFDEKPEYLTIQNSIQLAIIIPRPQDRSTEIVQKSLNRFSQKRFYNLAKQMLDYGYITPVLFDIAINTGNFGGPVVELSTSRPEVDAD